MVTGEDISTLRFKVIRQYKQLLFMGREYPYAGSLQQSVRANVLANRILTFSRGYRYFRENLHAGFKKNAGLTDVKEIEQKLKFAEYIERGIWYIDGNCDKFITKCDNRNCCVVLRTEISRIETTILRQR
ncbi:hypothetical protein V1523DRAFT_2167 [Lipomyces doorenjongii]